MQQWPTFRPYPSGSQRRHSMSARNGAVTVLCHHFGWIRVSSEGCDVEEQIEEMSTGNQIADARVAARVNPDTHLVPHERETRVRGWWGEVRDCYEMMEVGDGA